MPYIAHLSPGHLSVMRLHSLAPCDVKKGELKMMDERTSLFPGYAF
jgi:hypothetical protein